LRASGIVMPTNYGVLELFGALGIDEFLAFEGLRPQPESSDRFRARCLRSIACGRSCRRLVRRSRVPDRVKNTAWPRRRSKERSARVIGNRRLDTRFIAEIFFIRSPLTISVGSLTRRPAYQSTTPRGTNAVVLQRLPGFLGPISPHQVFRSSSYTIARLLFP